MIATKSAPRTLREFHAWLQDVFDGICEGPTANEIEPMLQQAFRYACKFGAGELVGTISPLTEPDEALVILGRLLAWTADKTTKPAELLSAKDIAEMLGVSERTVWRMVAADEIPQPVKVRGSTKWRRSEIQATIELLEPALR
ncbi:MAG: helix-turn-helix domain-containing protein [Pirellulales bacterium]